MRGLLIRRLLRKLRGGAYSVEELRAAGVHVGKNCYIGTRHIDLGHGFLIHIGDNVTISSARILAHDASTKRFLGYSKVGRVCIGDYSFVGAGAIILPGVSIGKQCVVGAGSVVTRDVPDGSVVAGNPARIIGRTDEMVERCRAKMGSQNTWDTATAEKGDAEKAEMDRILRETGIGFDV